MTDRHSRRMVIEQLEARLLYSADPITAAAGPMGAAGFPVLASTPETLAPQLHSAAVSAMSELSTQQPGTALVVVDARTLDSWSGVHESAQAIPNKAPLRAVVVAADDDGIAAISKALAETPGTVSHIEVVGYCADGDLSIGSTRLDLATIRARADEIARWSEGIDANADLRLIRTQLPASDRSGAQQGIAQALTQLTGARAEFVDPISPAHAAEPLTAQQPIREVFIIDGRVDDPAGLASDVLRDRGDMTGIAIHVLDPDEDGVVQVSRILAAHHNLDAVHLLAHGASGLIELGGTRLDADNLETHRAVLSEWGQALTSDGDLLLYGCSVAEQSAGQTFAVQLAAMTGADVAVSENLTGSSSLGGDWLLESHIGVIEAQGLFAREEPEWSGLLAITSGGGSSSTSSSSTNSVTLPFTVTAGTDRILIVSVAIDALGAPVTSVTYGGAPLTQIGRGAGVHAVEIWALTAPAQGSANVVVTLAGTTPVSVGVNSFNGVNQSTPTSGFTNASGLGTTASVDVASAPGHLVLDVQFWDNNPSGAAVGPGQTLLWTTGNPQMLGRSSTEPGAATVTMSNTVGSSVQWEIAGVSLVPAAGNVAPVLAAAGLTLNEGEIVTLAPGNFSITDPDSASFTYTLSSVLGGNFQLSSAPGSAISSFTSAQLAAGIVQFVDDGNEVAPSFNIRVNDGSANSNTLAATVNYTPINDEPIAVNDNASTLIDTPVSGNVRTNDTDVDGGVLSVTQFQVAGDPTVYGAGSTAIISGVGTLTLQANGNYTFTPTSGYNGLVPVVTYTISDGAGGSDTGALTITVGVSANGWGITGTNNLTEGQNASYSLTLSQSLLPGQSASVDLSLTDIGTIAADHASLVAAVNAAIAGRPDLSFDGTTLTYTAPAASSYNQLYNPTGAGGATSISGTGTALNLGDDVTVVRSLGFTFEFFGTSYNSVLIDANGEISFNTSVGSNYINVDMSGGNVLSGSPAIMAFWDDLDASAGGEVYSQTIGAVGSRQFIVEWSNVPYFGSGSTNGGTIQLVLNEGSNIVELRYLDVDFGPDASHDGGASATIGIQNGTGTGLQYSFDTASVIGGSSITYSPQAVAMAPLTITLGTVDDATVELPETFRIELSNSINSNLTANVQVITTINDNDNLPPVANNNTLAVTEDTAASIDVLVNDTDANGHALVISAATIDTDGNGTQNALTLGAVTGITDNAANPIGTITVNSNGLVSFTPAANYVGAVPVMTYTASDGFGGSDMATLLLGPVTAVNDAPVLTAASMSVNEGQTLTLTPASFSVTDPDNSSFTFTVSAISGGYFDLISAPGTPITSFSSAQLTANLVRFVDDGNELPPSFSVTVNDGAANSNTLSATVFYTPVNDAPSLSGASLTVSEGQTVTLTAANFSIADPDSASFNYTLSAVVGGYFQLSSAAGVPITSFTSAQLSATQVQFVDDGDEFAPSFDVTVSDGALSSGPVSATISFLPANDPPTVTAASLTINEGQTVTLTPANVTVSDSDSASFTFTALGVTGGFFQLTSAPGTPITSFTSAQLAGGLVQFVDDGNELAPAFSLRANDGTNNSNTLAATISYTPVNDAPVVTAANLLIAEGQTVTLAPANFTINDPDNATFTYNLSSVIGGFFQLTSAPGVPIASFTSAQLAGGLVQFVDDGNETAPSFDVSVSDGTLSSTAFGASVGFTPVNDAPTLVSASLTVSEGQTVTLSTSDFSVTDPDNASFTYTVSAVAGGFFQLTVAPGTPVTSFSTAQLAASQVQFVDDGNEIAPLFSVTVNDGAANSNTLAATISYTDLNDAPAVTAASLTLSEGQTVTLTPANVSVNDADNSVFTYTVSSVTGGFFQLSTAAGVPITSFTDAALAGGLVQFVDDGNELAPAFSIAASDGSATSSPLAATISYTPVNDAPVLTGGSLTLSEGQTVTLTAGNFAVSDPDSAAFNYTVSNVVGGFFQLSTALGVPITSFTTAQLSANQVQFVDDGNETAPGFDVSLDDGALGSATVGAVISYTPVNDAPTLAGLAGDSLSYAEGDGARVIEQASNVVVTDVDSADFSGGSLTVSIVTGTVATEDLLGVRHEGMAAGQIGVSGATLFYSGLSIGSIAGGASGSPLVITLGPGADTAAVSALIQNVEYTNGNTGNPTMGARTVRFVLNDGDGGVSLAHDANVTVSGVNDAPVLTGVLLTVNEAGTVTLAAADITLVDPDSSSFTYSVSSVAGGFFQLTTASGVAITSFTSADLLGGVVQFVDDGNELSPLFNLTANDGLSNSNTLAATVNYTPVNDAPLVTAANVTITEGLTLTLSPADFAVSDPDSTAFTYTVSAVSGGFFQLTNAPGIPVTGFTTADLTGANVQFVDDGNEVAPAFTIGVSDGSLPSNTLAATINFVGVNDAPLITAPVSAAVLEDNSLILNGGLAISVTDSDAGSASLQVQLSVGQGVMTLAATTGLTFSTGTGSNDAVMQFTGSAAAVNAALDGLTYTPPINFNGADVISINVSDLGNAGLGGALTANAAVALNVGAVNDAPSLMLPSAQLVSEDNALTFSVATGNSILISDLDAASGSLRLQLSTTQGVLSLSSVTGLSFVTGNGTQDSLMIFDGTLAAINSALNGLRYTPDNNFNGTDNLALSLSDLGNSGVGGVLSVNGSVSIVVSPVNDTPSIQLPAVQAVNEDTALVLGLAGGNAITIADFDAGAAPVELTLSADSGRLNLARFTGLSLMSGTGLNDAQISVRGTITDLNAALNGLTFLPDANFNGLASVTVTVNDLGNSGTGGVLTMTQVLAINVLPVNDAPIDLLRVPALLVTELSPVGTAAGDIVAVDLDDNTGFLFSLLDDAGHFQINASTGAITVASTALPDFDMRSSYQIRVRVSDAGGASADRSFTIAAARREFLPPLPPSREVGQPPSNDTNGKSIDERSSIVANDVDTDSRSRRGFLTDSGDSLARRSRAAAFVIRSTGNDNANGPRNQQALAAEAARAEELSLQIRDANGELLSRRSFDLRRLLSTLQFSPLRDSADTSSEFDVSRWNARLPANLIQWSNKESDEKSFHVTLESVQVGGVAVSIGLVFYAMRAGGLMAAMLTALPAWSSIDPLVVLSREKGERVDHWGDPQETEIAQDEAGVRDVIAGDHSDTYVEPSTSVQTR